MHSACVLPGVRCPDLIVMDSRHTDCLKVDLQPSDGNVISKKKARFDLIDLIDFKSTKT